VKLERLPTTQNISARTFVQGKYVRKSTGEPTLGAAKKVATNWYKTLLARDQMGEQLHTRLFADCAKEYLKTVDQRLAAGEISQGQRDNYHDKWSVLEPMLGTAPVQTMDTAYLQAFRVKRAAQRNKRKRGLSPSTIKKDLIFVMGVLEQARKMGALTELPDAPSFTNRWAIQRQGRPCLTEAEYKALHQLAKSQAEEPDLNPRVRRQRQELYWFILICVGGALRVGEAESVRWCDCEEVVLQNGTTKGEPAIRMLVLGKHSRGGKREEAYVLFGGVYAFKEMRNARPQHTKNTDLLFTESHREGMKELLKTANLYEYRDPKTGHVLTRDRKSLRPTGITLRLDKGDNLTYRDVAKWARTSVQMVADFYDQAHPERVAERVAGFRRG
jgi:integrase